MDRFAILVCFELKSHGVGYLMMERLMAGLARRYVQVEGSCLENVIIRDFCPQGVSTAVNVDPSPEPQTSFSAAVGSIFRCLPSNRPSGPKKSTQHCFLPTGF